MSNDILKREENTNVLVKFFKVAWNFLKVMLIVLIVPAFAFGMVMLMKYNDLVQNPYGKYEMTFKVYYTPNNVKTYTIKHNRPIDCGSDRGTNYIKKYGEGTVIRTNAPIEVVRYVNYDK